jgi:hypothetical protein
LVEEDKVVLSLQLLQAVLQVKLDRLQDREEAEPVLLTLILLAAVQGLMV